jgi:hypothetical protein
MPPPPRERLAVVQYLKADVDGPTGIDHRSVAVERSGQRGSSNATVFQHWARPGLLPSVGNWNTLVAKQEASDWRVRSGRRAVLIRAYAMNAEAADSLWTFRPPSFCLGESARRRRS